MENNLCKLNDYLFDEIEKLSKDIPEEKLNMEIQRSKAISSLAKNVIDNANVVLEAQKYVDIKNNKEMPTLLDFKSKQ